MRCVLKGARVFTDEALCARDVRILDGCIAEISPEILPAEGENVFFLQGCVLFPGFVDVHVHLREPGFSYKETIRTGTLAAARGGYTTVCAMPNLRPVPDDVEALGRLLAAIGRDARVRVVPIGAITRSERGETLSDLEEMAPFVAGFSDDGRGVQDEAVMREAMARARVLGKAIVAHCEDERLLTDVCVHEGAFSRKLGVRGNTAGSEWRQLERDLNLVRETGCRYHACHLSSAGSVELMRRAKAEGLDVSCETAPHYLLLNDEMLLDDGRFRMNPPVRTEDDRRALVEGLRDGTVDMVATDHAPHSREEKAGGFLRAMNGVVGLECAFPALYTGLVRTGEMPLETLVTRMSAAPAVRFGMESGIRPGAPADLAAWNLEREYTIDPDEFLSMGRSTPFAGMRVFGECMWTMIGGEIAWRK